jgi:hypothetical protein
MHLSKLTSIEAFAINPLRMLFGLRMNLRCCCAADALLDDDALADADALPDPLSLTGTMATVFYIIFLLTKD